MKIYPEKTGRSRQKKKWYIPIVASALILILGIQLFTLYTKLSDYRDKEAVLATRLEAAQAQSQELADYEAYTKTDEYILNTARSKLGMIKENEVIFKEKR